MAWFVVALLWLWFRLWVLWRLARWWERGHPSEGAPGLRPSPLETRFRALDGGHDLAP